MFCARCQDSSLKNTLLAVMKEGTIPTRRLKMEVTQWPKTSQDRINKIRDCAESSRESGILMDAKRLAWLANWTPRFAEVSIQWYSGLLNDARRGLE